MLSRSLVLALILLVNTACTTLDSTMSSWVGTHKDQLFQKWGPPSQEVALQDGGTSMVYVDQWATANQYGGNAGTCRKIFNTNASGTITSWSYSNCQWLLRGF
jgi:hypothetical protein